MSEKINFAESGRAERRWEEKFENPKPSPSPEPAPTPMAENTVPWKYRGRPLPRKYRSKTKRIPGTMLIPNDVGEIDWS